MSILTLLQEGLTAVEDELKALVPEALDDLETIIETVKNDILGGETAEEVVTAMLNEAESLGVQFLKDLETATLSAIAALILKAAA